MIGVHAIDVLEFYKIECITRQCAVKETPQQNIVARMCQIKCRIAIEFWTKEVNYAWFVTNWSSSTAFDFNDPGSGSPFTSWLISFENILLSCIRSREKWRAGSEKKRIIFICSLKKRKKKNKIILAYSYW